MDIFEYTDYRKYLCDLILEKRGSHRSLSLAYFGRKFGMSKMAVKYIIEQKRHLADDRVEGVAKSLQLDSGRVCYFQTLVRFNKSKSTSERNEHFSQLLKIKASPFHDVFVNHPQLARIQNWYFPAIAELSYVEGFCAEPAWIEKHLCFSVPRAEIRKALKTLSEMDLLAGGSHTKDRLKVSENIRSHVYKSLLKEQMDLGKMALDSQTAEDREYGTLTISVDEERYQVAKQLVQKFRHDLHNLLANDEACARVIQVNLQLFTLAKLKTSK